MSIDSRGKEVSTYSHEPLVREKASTATLPKEEKSLVLTMECKGMYMLLSDGTNHIINGMVDNVSVNITLTTSGTNITTR